MIASSRMTSLCSFFSLCLLVSSLPGAVVVTQSPDAPEERILASATTLGEGGLNWNGFAGSSSAWRDVGQAVYAGADWQVEGLTWYLTGFGTEALNAEFTLTIHEVTSNASSPLSGTLVATQTGTLPSSLEVGRYVTFTLDEAVSFRAGRYYTVMLHFDERGTATGSTTRRMLIFGYGDVSEGNPLGAYGTAWYSNTPFSTYYAASGPLATYVTGVVPEPSGMVLLGVAGAMAVGLCRRRRKGL